MKSPKRPAENKPAVQAVASASPSSTRWPVIIALFLFAFALLEIYQPALSGPFLFDDVYLPFMVPNFAQNPLRDWVAGVRPTLHVTYWLNYRLFGLDAFYFHLVNVVLHAAAGYFVWLISRKLLAYVKVEESLANVYALFAAAVFLLHPLQTESVAYVASRSEVVSGLFFLIAWTAFLYRREVAIRFGEAVLVLLFFVLALTSKEHMAVLPAVLLLTDYYFNPGFTLEGIKKNWRIYAPIFVGAALGVAVIFKYVLGRSTTAGFGMKDLTPLDYLHTQFRSVVTYLRLYFVPAGQNIDYDTPVSHSLSDHLSWLCLLILLALTALAWIYRRRFPLASFGFLLFLVLLAPTSSFVPIRDVLVERRMYLPVFALTLCVIDVLRQRRFAMPALGGGLAAVCVILGFLSWQRNAVWASPLALWKDTVANSPRKYRPRFQLAYAYYQAGQCADATQQYAEAAKLTAPSYELFVDWALAADCANKPGEALTRLEDALRVEQNAHAWALMGMVRAKQGDSERALEALAQGEKLNPRYAMLFAYRGNIYMGRQNWDGAVAEFEKAVALEPNEATAREGLEKAKAARKRAGDAKAPAAVKAK
ncbi:MAG: tetratricopeptide repeat protein [Acidobacteria bacterium]|nr:tetratricopeptide repeat protein [Acidobacteriota bacterium]